MRPALGLRTALLLPVVLAVGALAGPAGSSTAPSAARGVATYGFIKAQVFTVPGRGQVAVGMPSPKVVKVQHRTGDGGWSRPAVLFRKSGVTCGDIDGRASAGGVALTLKCDTPYHEEEAPRRSMGFVTRDLTTWVGKRLPGESYHDPAVSADGEYAAWLVGGDDQDFVRNSASTGWTAGLSSFDDEWGGEAVVVDDEGTVTVIGPENDAESVCRLGVHDVTTAGAEDAYVIGGVELGCSESSVENVDDHTVTGGGTSREYRFAVTRQPGERWALTLPPPATAAGLVTQKGPHQEVIRNFFSRAPGLPLVSFFSPDRQHLQVQTFDEQAGTWNAPTTVYDHGFPGCTAYDLYYLSQAPGVHVIPVNCYPKPNAQGVYPPRSNGGAAPRNRVLLLTSPDAQTWTRTAVDRRPFGVSRTGRLLAAAGPRSITIVSPEGTTTVPRTAPGPCDFVFPIGPDSVLRFHGDAADRWPTRLQKSVAGGAWKTIQTVKMPTVGGCRRVSASIHDLPSLFHLDRPPQTIKLTVLRGGEGGWHVKRTGYRF